MSRITSVSKRRDLLVLAAAQSLELAHADQRVLVDRVDVVQVALHQAVDASELGKEPAEHADLVHLAQRLPHVGFPAQDVAERADERAVVALGFADQVQVLAHQPLRALGDLRRRDVGRRGTT